MTFIEPPKIEKPKEDKALTLDQHFDRLLKLQELQKQTSLWRDSIEIHIETGKLPYLFYRPLSDLHIGNIGTQTKEVQNHIQDIKTKPIITSLHGDFGDFFSPKIIPEGMMGDAINPDDQLSIFRRFFEYLKDKTIATVQDPSHTDWIRKAAGIEPQRYVTEGLKIPALKNGGILHLYVNDIYYKGLMFHKIGKYNSSLNITNGGKRMLDMLEDADFVICGHTHIGDIEKLVKRNKKVIVCQLGTFKTSDGYGEREGLVPRPQLFYPTLFFDGRKKNIENFEDREAANEIIDLVVEHFTK